MFKRCTACGVEKAPQDFYKRGDSDKLRSHCRACCDTRTKRAAKADPLTHSGRSHKHYLKKLYDLTPADYARMLAEQRGVCAICEQPSKWRLAVDHCHVTDKVRGLLCMACNTALGKFRDSTALLLTAHAYLLSHA